MDEQEKRLMPLIHPDSYLAPIIKNGITPEEKATFLRFYYESGNKTLAAKGVNRDDQGMTKAMQRDKGFLEDFIAVQNAMRHNLEQTMYQNGLKEKGYMDRITWLRTHFPKDYNPNYVNKDSNPTEVIKELSQKLGEYQLIPKKDVLDVNEDRKDK